MTTIVGGIRHRLLHDSVSAHLMEALAILGWLDPNRAHKPIRVIDAPTHWTVPVLPNTIAIDVLGSDTYEVEVGSRLLSDVIITYIDIYAEDDSFGVHLANDLRDWLRGRLQTTFASFPIFDFREATPGIIGYMDIRNVSALRNASITAEMWMRHWYRVRCEITDTYSASTP